MISFKQKGDFKRTNSFLEKVLEISEKGILDKYGSMGVEALKAATPKDTGTTAASWSYEIKHYNGGSKITWKNSNAPGGIPVAVLIQYGHATGNGGYVEGIDYINPAMKPIFDEIATNAWKEVTRA